MYEVGDHGAVDRRVVAEAFGVALKPERNLGLAQYQPGVGYVVGIYVCVTEYTLAAARRRDGCVDCWLKRNFEPDLACKLAVEIKPCASDKKLVGYGGDLWRKEWLLRHEGSLPKQEQLNLF